MSQWRISVTGMPTLSSTPVKNLDQGRICASEDACALLESSGLNTFESIMAVSGGKMMRSVPGRSTVRLILRKPSGEEQTVYLKRYTPEYLSFGKKLLRFINWPTAADEALHEWRAINRLRAEGFNAAKPIAFGQERREGIVQRSFLITAGIENGIAGHNYVRELGFAERRKLCAEMAQLTRRFHGHGFAHKDYYLSHFFISKDESGARQLFLIDLQRLFVPRLFSKRWRIKDLAFLAYSSLLEGATHTDLMRFYRMYSDVRSISDRDKQLIRRIWARVEKLQRRKPKYDVIWDKPGAHPKGV
jgi:hypothetical protein